MNEGAHFNLGDEVKDQITGYQGIVIARTQWLRQCDRYTVQSRQLDKDGNPMPYHSFDADDLILIEANVIQTRPPVERTNGGPRPEPTRS